MSCIMVEYVLRGWLCVVPIEPTIGSISPGELACLNMILSSHVD